MTSSGVWNVQRIGASQRKMLQTQIVCYISVLFQLQSPFHEQLILAIHTKFSFIWRRSIGWNILLSAPM